jgi:predicted transcriptional regulator
MAQTYLSKDDYVDALKSLDGEATTSELAEAVDRDNSVVRRRMKDIDEVNCITVGNSYLYQLADDPQEDDD